MSKKSFSKGYAFERGVAKILSLWVSEGKDGFLFNRRAGSGGSARDIQGRSSHAGDLYADKPEGNHLMSLITIECKFYENLETPFAQFVQKGTGIITDFVAQVERSAKVYKRDWFLIIKSNYKKPIIITNRGVWISHCDRTKIEIIKGSKKEIYFICEFENLLSIAYSNSMLAKSDPVMGSKQSKG